MKLQIKTTFHGATNTRGAIIRATFNGKARSMPYDYSLSGEKLHAKAASEFASKYGLTIDRESSGDHAKGYFFPVTGI